MSSAQSQSYECKHCKKRYLRRDSLTKHAMLCDFKHKTPTEMEEWSDMPTHEQLVHIVHDLHAKWQQTEAKLARLQPYVRYGRKRERVQTVDWLNAHAQASMSYDEWVQSYIQVKLSHLDCIFEESLFQTVQLVLEDNLNNPDVKYPLVSFQKFPGVIYIARFQGQDKVDWTPMTPLDFTRCLKTIQFQLINLLTKWKIDHWHRYQIESDAMCSQHDRACSKLATFGYGGSNPSFNRMKQGLYQHVKMRANLVDVDLVDEQDVTLG